MEKEKLFDLLVVVFIVVAGLFTAYITFGILESSAEANIQQYKVGGAVAGALISWSMLASVYLQIRKSSGELKELRDRNQELQQKLIRGAPRPSGFDTEVSEQQRIVLARPRDWERRGGIIFDYELPESQLKGGDVLPARFACSFIPITKENENKEDYYKTFLEGIDETYIKSFTTEIVCLGGEPHSVESLKLICRQFARVIEEKNSVTGVTKRFPTFIREEEFNDAKDAAPPPETDPKKKEKAKKSAKIEASIDGVAPSSQKIKYYEVLRMYVVCHNKDLGVIFFFDFADNIEDFAESSALFNQILLSIRFLT